MAKLPTNIVSPVSPPTEPPQNRPVGFGAKEREIFERQDELQLEEIRKELEIAPEVKEAGIEIRHEEIELPEPVAKMGVTQANDAASPLPATPVSVPLADDTIIKGAGASVWASLTWLAHWCLRQLKKVHIKLKKVQGKIVRIATK